MNKGSIYFFEDFAKKFDEKNYTGKKNGLFPQQNLVVKFLQEPKTRGLLLYHGLGSGKTIASIASALNLMKTTDIKNACIFLPGFLSEGFREEVVQYSGKKNSEGVGKYEFFVYNANNIRDQMYQRFGAKQDDFSDLILKMQNQVLIFDEAHHIISMMHNALIVKEKDGKEPRSASRPLDKQIGLFFYELLMNLKNVKIMFLTATPITNYAYEAAVLGNVLYGRETVMVTSDVNSLFIKDRSFTLFPENSQIFYDKFIDPTTGALLDKSKGEFERRFTGLISYYPSSQVEYPSIKERIIARLTLFYNMDQYIVYNQIFGAEKQHAYQMRLNHVLSSNFRIFSRMASNFVFPLMYFEKFKNVYFKNGLESIKEITLAEFMSFEYFKRFCRKKGVVDEKFFNNFFYKSLFKCFVDVFFESDLYKYYFEEKEPRVGLLSFSVKLYDLKQQLREINENEEGIMKNQKVLIYSNFVNYAGKQSIEALLNYMGYNKEDNKEDNREGNLQVGQKTAQKEPRTTNNFINLFKDDSSTDENENENEGETQQAMFAGQTAGEGNRPGNSQGKKTLSFECIRGEKFISKLKPDRKVKLENLPDYQNNLRINKGKKYLCFEGNAIQKKKIVDKFNKDPDCQILIISSSGSEGLDLKNVRYVFIMEPFWNMTRIEQVIGRAKRYRSHVELNEDKREIAITEMITLLQSDEGESFGRRSVDWAIRQLALRKSGLIENILESFKNSSIDCSYYETRRTCSRFKYDMTTFDKNHMSTDMYNLFPGKKANDMSSHWDESSGFQLSKFSNISQYLEGWHYELFPLIRVDQPQSAAGSSSLMGNNFVSSLKNTIYLGRVKNATNKVFWKIILFNGDYYTAIGTLYKRKPDVDESYDLLVKDKNKDIIYELNKSELQRGIFNPKI